MNEFLSQFPNLWEMFCVELKNAYIENKEAFFKTKENEPMGWPESLYDKMEVRFWRIKDGKGRQWMGEFEEKYHLYNRDMFGRIASYKTLSEEINQISFTEDDTDSSKSLSYFIEKMKWKYSEKYRKNKWSECFEKTWMPALKKRRDEIIEFLHEVNEKSKLPIDYDFEFGLKHRVALQFKDTRMIKHSGMKGLDGYQYTLNGRTYTDISSLHDKRIEDITKKIYINEDIHGSKVLCVYTPGLAFDDADREWDSRSITHLMFDGKDINLIDMRGGYKIASLTFYYKLLTADVEMKPYLEKLGFPTENIVWKEKSSQEDNKP